MKQTKRLAALFLAMVMALAMLAMPAMAYGEDEHVHTAACSEESVIMPRLPAKLCPSCRQQMSSETKTEGGVTWIRFWCTPCDERIDWRPI